MQWKIFTDWIQTFWNAAACGMGRVGCPYIIYVIKAKILLRPTPRCLLVVIIIISVQHGQNIHTFDLIFIKTPLQHFTLFHFNIWPYTRSSLFNSTFTSYKKTPVLANTIKSKYNNAKNAPNKRWYTMNRCKTILG